MTDQADSRKESDLMETKDHRSRAEGAPQVMGQYETGRLFGRGEGLAKAAEYVRHHDNLGDIAADEILALALPGNWARAADIGQPDSQEQRIPSAGQLEIIGEQVHQMGLTGFTYWFEFRQRLEAALAKLAAASPADKEMK